MFVYFFITFFHNPVKRRIQSNNYKSIHYVIKPTCGNQIPTI